MNKTYFTTPHQSNIKLTSVLAVSGVEARHNIQFNLFLPSLEASVTTATDAPKAAGAGLFGSLGTAERAANEVQA